MRIPTSILSRGQAIILPIRTRTCQFHSSTLLRVVYKNVDRNAFEKAIQAKDRLVLVDFYADWCGPCRQLSPVLEKLCSDADIKSGVGRHPVDLVKVDIESDDGSLLAQQYGVSALPTILALRDGQIVDHFRGAIPEPAVRKFIEKL